MPPWPRRPAVPRPRLAARLCAGLDDPLALLGAPAGFGKTALAIAERLVITVGTVKWHLNHLYAKLDVRGRTAALAQARALGLLP